MDKLVNGIPDGFFIHACKAATAILLNKIGLAYSMDLYISFDKLAYQMDSYFDQNKIVILWIHTFEHVALRIEIISIYCDSSRAYFFRSKANKFQKLNFSSSLYFVFGVVFRPFVQSTKFWIGMFTHLFLSSIFKTSL